MNIRWRLARAIAGQSIIPDPTEGKDGAAVVVRDGPATMSFRADTFRMRSKVNPSPLKLAGLDVTELSHRWGSTVTFAGRSHR